MKLFSKRKAAKFINELRGLEDEITLFRNGELPNSQGILEDLYWQRNQTSDVLKALGVSIALVGNGDRTRHEPIVPEELQLNEPPPLKKDPPTKWRRYGAYAVAGLLIGASLLGFYGAWIALKDWKGLDAGYEPPSDAKPPRRREENNTTEQPEVPVVPEQPTNQTPQNQTPQNQTPIQIKPDTPDFLSKFSGSVMDYISESLREKRFFGRYEIADAEHNPNGNYSFHVKDSNGSVIQRGDLNDKEGLHEFSFSVEKLEKNKKHTVEILRNGTPAYDPIEFLIPETPDFLKYLTGLLNGEKFVGKYGIGDAEHNPDGNYSMRLLDENGSTILETDLDDSEGEHEFWFETNNLKTDVAYIVEVLRDGARAHDPISLKIPNALPKVSIEGRAELVNGEKVISYSGSASDDRGLERIDIVLYGPDGKPIQTLETIQTPEKSKSLSGSKAVSNALRPGQGYYVVARAYDKDGSVSEMAYDFFEMPNIAPKIKGGSWSFDKARDRFVADVDFEDSDGPKPSASQKLTDSGSPVSIQGSTGINGSRAHAEIKASGLDSVYDWEVEIDDGYFAKANQTFKNVWGWMRGLTGHWKFDESDGEVISDSASGNNGFTHNSPQFVKGKIGNALKFDGINDEAQIPDNDAYHSKDFTISLWFNAETLKDTDYKSLFNKGGNGGFVIMTYNSPGSNRIRIMDGGDVVGETPNLNENTWYFLTFVSDGSYGKVRTYLDGTLVDEKNNADGVSVYYDSIRIGTPYADGTAHFGGVIDDLRFYGRALPERHVKEIYKEAA